MQPISRLLTYSSHSQYKKDKESEMNKAERKEQNTGQTNAGEGSAADYNHIKYVYAVMSGKGGVGKSFVTGLLASALARTGNRVGILDADITGPSIPTLFGLHGPVSYGTVGIEPLESRSGIKVISMNLLLPSEDLPVVWRGPLISRAITQLWGDVMWGTLDYLLVDLPPGTSDAALTILQSLPLKGIVMVTTPQGLANMVVRKAVYMAHSVNVPIVGIIENMAYFRCPDNSKTYNIFGPSHSDDVAHSAHAPILARIPIDMAAAIMCDAGQIEDLVMPEISAMLETFNKPVAVSNL
jgi:Mrp family chromosome partitioning ATPase